MSVALRRSLCLSNVSPAAFERVLSLFSRAAVSGDVSVCASYSDWLVAFDSVLSDTAYRTFIGCVARWEGAWSSEHSMDVEVRDLDVLGAFYGSACAVLESHGL